jgi:3-isopropylmalate/(R)-2-methylmalate dehydratase small subunit
MEKFEVIETIAAPLLQENIDTDVIIRIERLTAAQPDLRRWTFEALRYLPDGSPHPDFILNRPPYDRAQILLAGKNFGCGSSREGAVQGLAQMGFRCVIAPSFGDIFFGNCFQNGVLPVLLPADAIASIAQEVAADPAGRRVTVDLPGQLVVSPGGSRYTFDISALRKEALVEGLDELGLTLKREPQIARFEQADRARRPWIHQLVESWR